MKVSEIFLPRISNVDRLEVLFENFCIAILVYINILFCLCRRSIFSTRKQKKTRRQGHQKTDVIILRQNTWWGKVHLIITDIGLVWSEISLNTFLFNLCLLPLLLALEVEEEENSRKGYEDIS